MTTIAYYRVSSGDQSIESQKNVLEKTYKLEKQFMDEGISGTIAAMQRPGFKACFDYLRDEDTLIVYDLDRLGRDSIDIQNTIAALKAKYVKVIIHSMGIDINSDAGELLVTIMSKVAELERKKILARTQAGREAAKKAGKHMGRPTSTTIEQVAECRNQGMSIQATANKLSCSLATVKNHTAKAKAQGLIPE